MKETKNYKKFKKLTEQLHDVINDSNDPERLTMLVIKKLTEWQLDLRPEEE